MRLGEIVVIHDLKRQGLSVTAIARKVGLDRKTVRRHLERGLEAPAYGPRPPRERLIDPFADYLRERVTSYPDLSGRRLLREVRDLGYTGCYSVVTDLLREARPSRPKVFERRFETPPGRQAQVDFAQFRVEFADEPGVTRILWLFTLILGHSRWLWGRFCPTQDLQTVLRCHIDAFAAMGGAPSHLLYDRMKTAVIGESEEGVVTYNTSLVALLNHYGAIPRACRPYRAKTKGKVERPYRYVRQDFFLARSFVRHGPRTDGGSMAHHGRPQPPVRRVAGRDRQPARPRHHRARGRRALCRGTAGADRAPGHPLQRRAHRRAARQPRGHGLGGRQPLLGARRHAKARRRGPEPPQGGPDLRGRPARRQPPRLGGAQPAPGRPGPPQGSAALRLRAERSRRRTSAARVSHDAVGRRLAAEGAAS